MSVIAERPTHRTALVTGASSGIGLELTRLLAADQHDLVIVGRDRNRLQRVGADLVARFPIAVRCETCNLGEPRTAFELWNGLAAAGVSIDVLINNAGVGMYGKVEEQDPFALDRMVQLNTAALTTLTRLVLPGMQQRHWGRILNVASVVAYQPGGPRMAVYYATKAYVLSFSRGLARELRGTGVSVTVLAPGPTETAFDDGAGANVDVPYKRVAKMSAAAVAKAGYNGMQQEAREVVPGLMTKVLALAGELAPRPIGLEVNRLIWEPSSKAVKRQDR
ncbi:MAG TPA: SDR family oxidoreductase [Vicinamibacterales bacterium]|nr:SDR family oxidoreductase [Vicinamibacterales bacterium]